MCGCHNVPPFAKVAYASASCNGVTATPPCPTAVKISSAGYHCPFSRFCSAVGQILSAIAFFHVGFGTVPDDSSSSIPVFAPKPNSCATCCKPRPPCLSPAFHRCQKSLPTV